MLITGSKNKKLTEIKNNTDCPNAIFMSLFF